ncbi:MAG: tetratricopeptide repeat protein [Deferribacteraceae bacterium]|jgi:tetratricopeptide (TPR) repeat protein|nr:tetratricopeptide repeat protein [Deferribacteraceae bacterium]
MYTLLIAVIAALLLFTAIFWLSGSYIISALIGVLSALAINILVGRYFSKKIMALMESVEKDLKADRIESALERLKSAYKYTQWQFLSKKNIDSQIGCILYVRKRFDEALPYLKNSFVRNWSAMGMLASYYYRGKEYNKAFEIMEKTVAVNKKEGFVYSLYAYFLSEQGKTDKAISVLTKGVAKIPLNERLAGELDNLKNRKKIKMQAYGTLWIQMHLGKAPEGAKQYQALLANQRIKRR